MNFLPDFSQRLQTFIVSFEFSLTFFYFVIQCGFCDCNILNHTFCIGNTLFSRAYRFFQTFFYTAKFQLVIYTSVTCILENTLNLVCKFHITKTKQYLDVNVHMRVGLYFFWGRFNKCCILFRSFTGALYTSTVLSYYRYLSIMGHIDLAFSSVKYNSFQGYI